jgi:hypothetical protein
MFKCVMTTSTLNCTEDRFDIVVGRSKISKDINDSNVRSIGFCKGLIYNLYDIEGDNAGV